MARGVQVILRPQIRRWVVILLIALFVMPDAAEAAPPPPPMIGETDWRTGEIEICWSGVIPGHTIILYVKTHKDSNYRAHDAWTAETSSGCYISKFFENGQTVWHYIVQVDPNTGEMSEPSNEGRQTPPITAFIINWPNIFEDLKTFFQQLDQGLKDHLDGLFTPSQQAMDDLKSAIDGLKGALGAGQATGAGSQLQSGFNDVASGLRPPAVVDDGNGTFTGGAGGPQLPQPNTSNGAGLNYPNPDSGTSNELTIRIPYGVDMQGNLLYVKILTQEQLEKMKWLGLLRTLAAATIWILFAMWLLHRFAPQLKS